MCVNFCVCVCVCHSAGLVVVSRLHLHALKEKAIISGFRQLLTFDKNLTCFSNPSHLPKFIGKFTEIGSSFHRLALHIHCVNLATNFSSNYNLCILIAYVKVDNGNLPLYDICVLKMCIKLSTNASLETK